MAFSQPPISLVDIEQLRILAEGLDREFHGGFALLINKASDDGVTCWTMVTNVVPRDLVVALKLQIARLEGQPLTSGHA